MGKSKNMKIRAKAAKKKASDLVENKEKKIEKGINNFLKRDTKKVIYLARFLLAPLPFLTYVGVARAPLWSQCF